MEFLSMTLVLFLIMDPLGNIASFQTVLSQVPPPRQKWAVARELLFALIAMIIFIYFGDLILQALQISRTSVFFASGLILFLFAIKILYPSPGNPRTNLPKGEPFIIPLAIPLVASPSLLAVIMLYAHAEADNFIIMGSILIAWVASLAILLLAKPLHRLLGDNGLMACERLTALILVMLGVQRFSEGIRLFVSTQ